ncbi:hypothetical protein [Chitinophaga sp. YIM B06452]|uniref:hypothetical protein n=1 Tax=Chitinophaga sp. YIM B06452 TaxID=3082158 RepID=UPI0031FF31FA
MKKAIPVIIAIAVASCQQKGKSVESPELAAEKAAFVRNYTDSITKASERMVWFDTIGIENSPIKIKRAWLHNKEYSNYKDISLTFKNEGTKTVEGVKFRWYGENVFGDPADMGSSLGPDGFGGGFMDKKLKPGQTLTLTWNILSKDGRKVIKAWPTEVVFSDGSKWESTYK